MFRFANVNINFRRYNSFQRVLSKMILNVDLCSENLSRWMEHGIGSFNWPNVRRNVNTSPCCVWTKVCGHKEIIKEPVTTGGFKVMSKCKGVTRAHLMEDLDAEALQSIRECFDRLMAFAESENIIGVTADFGNLWLKHHSAVRKLITEVPVYLTPIVQLPMISASFKSREQTLLVTWGSRKMWRKWSLVSWRTATLSWI